MRWKLAGQDQVKSTISPSIWPEETPINSPNWISYTTKAPSNQIQKSASIALTSFLLLHNSLKQERPCSRIYCLNLKLISYDLQGIGGQHYISCYHLRSEPLLIFQFTFKNAIFWLQYRSGSLRTNSVFNDLPWNCLIRLKSKTVCAHKSKLNIFAFCEKIFIWLGNW